MSGFIGGVDVEGDLRGRCGGSIGGLEMGDRSGWEYIEGYARLL